MFWRILVILVTVFWLVMTGLLLRVTYYPEGSEFARLSPAAVFKIFLDHGMTLNALHVYHGEKKLGHAMLTPRRSDGDPAQGDYTLMLSGVLEKGAFEGVKSTIAWRVNLNLHAGERWGGASGQVRLPEESQTFEFDWPQGSPTPQFTLHRHGLLVVDDKALQMITGQFGPNPGEGSAAKGAGQDDFMKVTAREGSMKIAGQRRKGYVIEFILMDHYRAKAFFTEAGELALVELPEGYRAVEPVIHGLVPDEPDEDAP